MKDPMDDFVLFSCPSDEVTKKVVEQLMNKDLVPVTVLDPKIRSIYHQPVKLGSSGEEK